MKPKRYLQVETSYKTWVGTYPVGVKSQKSTNKANLLHSVEEYRSKNCSKFRDSTFLRERLTQVGRCSRCLHIRQDGRLTFNESPVDVMDIIDEVNEPAHKLWELASIGIDPAGLATEDDSINITLG
ncbi:hypothetical protein SK128_026902 [Halocaridina rubra]|uniref:Uncharacterized protein n=1 Tax=Halocaridina rubra TaxID=373956 RepID=A0AAN8WZ41_HALRR